MADFECGVRVHVRPAEVLNVSFRATGAQGVDLRSKPMQLFRMEARQRKDFDVLRSNVMMREKRRTVRVLLPSTIASVILATASHSFAANIPERFRGVWQAVESESVTCRASDWNSDRHTDTHVKVEIDSVRHHESDCRFRSVIRPKPPFDGGGVHVTMACDGEGERWTLTEVWQTRSINGIDMLTMTNVSKQRPGTSFYRKCADGAERSGRPHKTGDVAAGATPRHPEKKADDLRAGLTPGRHCFASKATGADFYLDIDSKGSASFGIDVVNHNTRHLCSAGGTTIVTAKGWRYVDTSQPEKFCQLDIEVSDRIRFRFDTDDCERRYCGARASITAAEFSQQDRKTNCPPR